jgi:integrase
VSKVLTLFKAMLSGAVHDGLLAANPLDGLKLPSQAREEMRFLAPGELLRLADAIDGRYRALVFVGGYGGLRIGELAGLQVQDLDMLRGAVEVQRQVVEVAGKLTVGPLKTKASRRKVKLPRFVVDELVAHLAGRAGSAQPVDLVFPAPGGGLLSRTMFRQRFWLPATRAAGLDGVRVHDLRHSAVALWIEAGYSPKAIAVRAGHTSVRTVLDIYGHLLPDADDALADALDKLACASETRTGHVLELSKQTAAQ